MPTLQLHVLPPSHPCMTAEAALRRKGLEYEKVTLVPGPHVEQMQELYGARTVPGMLVDGEPVHGSRAILARLEELAPEPSLYPEPIADAVREAERWGDEELQDLGRRFPWGALAFHPWAMGTMTPGGTALNGAGTQTRAAGRGWGRRRGLRRGHCRARRAARAGRRPIRHLEGRERRARGRAPDPRHLPALRAPEAS